MPDHVLVSIAAALASKAAMSVYEFVKKKFAERPGAAAVLDAAGSAAPDSLEVKALCDELTAAERSDPEFGNRLRALWQRESTTLYADSGGVVNQITGNVSGKVVQARDIEGGISF